MEAEPADGGARAPLFSTRIAVICAVALTALGAASAAARIHFGDGVARWTEIWNLDAEANVPTWFGSVLLLRCAMACARAARRLPHATRWRSLGAIFVALSIDEVARL